MLEVADVESVDSVLSEELLDPWLLFEEPEEEDFKNAVSLGNRNVGGDKTAALTCPADLGLDPIVGDNGFSLCDPGIVKLSFGVERLVMGLPCPLLF